MDDRSTQILNERFQIEERIGEGQMGEVFSARDLVLERRVAIKMLKQGLDAEFVQRFQREAKIIAQLSSNPHVITVYDVGETPDNAPFLVTEFLSGNPLADELRSKFKPARSWVLDVAVQIASALADAHENGIVHRDLKPENVFVMRHAVLPALVKVLDFGLSLSNLANRSDGTSSQPGRILGNLRHMAPEIFDGEKATSKSDIYALGIMLYELATGRYPYDASTPGELLRAHLADEIRPFPEEAIPFPPEFESLLRQMLMKVPSSRPTAMECLKSVYRLQNSL